MKKKSFILVTYMIVITLSFIGTMGIHPVSASPGPADVYIFPPSRTGPYSAGQLLTYQVRLNATAGSGAPHQTSESAVSTDKTWAWEVVIDYDPSVISIQTSGTSPYRHSSRDWFNFFHKYFWDEDFEEWGDEGSYSNFFAGTADDTKGEVAATNTMTEDITTRAIETGTGGHPQAALHAGSNYDLPWSDNIQGTGLYTYNYFILFIFRVYLKVPVGAGETVTGTTLAIAEANFIQYDKTTAYSITTEDATIGTPAVPEFPLGLGLMMAIAPLIPIVYLLRLRKKVPKQ